MSDSIYAIRFSNGTIGHLVHQSRDAATEAATEIKVSCPQIGPMTIVEYIPAGWRSMETAPRDRQIMGNTLTRAGPYVVHYSSAIDAWRDIDGNVHETREIDGWFPIPEDEICGT